MPKLLKYILPKYSLLEHFTELKRRFILVFIWFVVATIISYCFSEEIFQFLLQPLVNSTSAPVKVIYTGLTEAFHKCIAS